MNESWDSKYGKRVRASAETVAVPSVWFPLGCNVAGCGGNELQVNERSATDENTSHQERVLEEALCVTWVCWNPHARPAMEQST